MKTKNLLLTCWLWCFLYSNTWGILASFSLGKYLFLDKISKWYSFICFVHFRYVYGFSVWAHFTLGHQTTCLAPTQLDHSQNGKIPTCYQWRFLFMSKQVFHIQHSFHVFLFHEWTSVSSQKEFSTWNNGVFLKITFFL